MKAQTTLGFDLLYSDCKQDNNQRKEADECLLQISFLEQS